MEKAKRMELLVVPAHYLGQGRLCPGAGVVVPESEIEAKLRFGQKAVTCLSCHITLIGKKPSH